MTQSVLEMSSLSLKGKEMDGWQVLNGYNGVEGNRNKIVYIVHSSIYPFILQAFMNSSEVNNPLLRTDL